MPIHVDIMINDRHINSIHIGRLEGGTNEDDNNTYIVIEGDRPTSTNDWYDTGVEFTHRYGDGAEVCVLKGLKALGYE